MSHKLTHPIIMGVDPGTLVAGWGIISLYESTLIPLDFGCIKPSSKMLLTDRYLVLFESMEHLLDRYQPTALAVETQFVNKNSQSALKLGMARAALILPAKKRKIPVFEYAPSKIKLSVSGRGNASKRQVQSMVKTLLNLDQLPEPEDAADALACALCHEHMARYHEVLGEF